MIFAGGGGEAYAIRAANGIQNRDMNQENIHRKEKTYISSPYDFFVDRRSHVIRLFLDANLLIFITSLCVSSTSQSAAPILT